jgi:hypothetical protein
MNTRVTKSTVAPVLLLLAVLLLSPSAALGGGRRRVIAVSPPPSPLAITFVGSGPVIDTGTIVSRGGRKAAAISTRTVSMRIGEPSREARGTATVRAYVETVDPRCTIRIDGVTLTAAPRLIRRNAPVGVAATYRIEIEVPITAAEGPLQTSIGWEVTEGS